jgi:RsiW-degrading membrane proteinase PrsW (M82 family)/multisubunit Na+/H+ antiporter MnhG subunit
MLAVLLSALLSTFAGALGYLLWRRIRRLGRVSRRLAIGVALGGALSALVTTYLEAAILEWTGLSLQASVAGAGSALLAMFLLAAPLEEAAKVLVIWPLYRTRRIDGARQGLAYAAVAGAGFAAAQAVASVAMQGVSGLGAARAALGIPAHLFFAGLWGYALASRGAGGRWFPLAWLVAVTLHGTYDHLVWGRGPGFLVMALPMLAFMALGAWAVLRGPAPEQRPSGPPRPSDPPSLSAMQRALGPADQPVMLRWVAGGAFVTLGLIIALLALAVYVGHRIGIDFSLADESDVRSAGPLILLGAAMLLAFPLSGYLIARASSAASVLEPALAAGAALAALVALLALTAPIGVLFTLAVAPLAFGLACGGAWVGLER